MAWPTFTVDVTQNSNQIKIYGPVPASEIPAGFEVIINGIGNLEVSYGTAVMYDGSHNPYSHLYLARPYKGSTASNVEMVVKPTGSQFNDVVGIFQNASNLLNSTMAGFRQFVEGTSPVTFQPLDENAEPISIKPLLQMNEEAQAAVSEAISAFQNAAGTAVGYDVTSSATDTGNGANGQPKLLKVGDGGLLQVAPPLLNPDNINYSVFFRCRKSIEGGTYPDGISQLWGVCCAYDTNYRYQLASSSSAGLGRTFVRIMHAGVWQQWGELYRADNTGSIKQVATANDDRLLVGTNTDNGVDKLQVDGSLRTVSSNGAAVSKVYLGTVNGASRSVLTYFIGGSRWVKLSIPMMNSQRVGSLINFESIMAGWNGSGSVKTKGTIFTPASRKPSAEFESSGVGGFFYSTIPFEMYVNTTASNPNVIYINCAHSDYVNYIHKFEIHQSDGFPVVVEAISKPDLTGFELMTSI